jgi:isoleucyl-tRNA synthetase
MKGSRVIRKGGWDTHGLPVELQMEQELGLNSKREIEEFGIAEFNRRCRESVFRYVKEWEVMTDRIGYWVDMEDPYVTLENDYIETGWWILKSCGTAGCFTRIGEALPIARDACPAFRPTRSRWDTGKTHRTRPSL